MADNKYISLMISGRPDSNSGFNPQVWFNSPQFVLQDTVYGGFNVAPYFFTFKIDANRVVYNLIMNNIRSNGGIRLGTLQIAISIPKGYILSNGVTPYDVLIQIKDSFASSHLTCKDPVKQVYEFNKGNISNTCMDSEAQKFTIEPAPGPYRPMANSGSKGYIILPEDKIKLLLSDVQFKEFSHCSEIVVATDGSSTEYTPITLPQIPRVRRFLPTIDGVEDGYIDDLDYKIKIQGKKNPRYYINKELNFSINDIRQGSVIPNVTLDENNETISISTASLSCAKEHKVNITFTPQEAANTFYTLKSAFQLTYDGRVIDVDDKYCFKLKGEEIGWLEKPSSFNPTFSKKDDYRINSFKLEKKEDNESILNIEVKKVVKEIPASHQPNTPVFGQKIPNVIVIDVKVPDYKYVENMRVYLRQKNRNDIGSQFLQSCILDNNNGNCKIYISGNSDTDSLFIHYKTSKYNYESLISVDKKTNTYTANQFEKTTPISFYNRVISPKKGLFALLLGLLLGLILGGSLGVFAIFNENKEELTCETCKKRHVFVSAYKADIESHKNINCEHCGAPFTTPEEKKLHISEKHLTFDCNDCTAEFGTNEELEKHINDVHLTHKCDKCQERFATTEELNKHKTEKHPIVPGKPHKCLTTGCGKSFATVDELFEHTKTVHNNYFCKICGQDVLFHTQTELDAHIRCRHGINER